MKILKILIATVLSIALVLPTVPVVFASDSVNSTEISNELKLLEKIGVINADDMAKPWDAEMTRAEFAMVMIKLYGKDIVAYSLHNTNYFSDVSPEYEEAGYINAAYSLGLMNGTEDGKFLPKKAVDGESAVISAAIILGYGKLLEDSEDKFISAQKILSTNKGGRKIIFNRDTVLTRGQVYEMVEHIMEGPTLKVTGMTDNNETFETGYTVLSEYHNVYDGVGVVTANSLTSVTSQAGNTGNEQVKIGGKTFNDTYNLAYDLLGYNVKFWYQEDDTTAEGTIVFAEKYNNETIELNQDNIINCTSMQYTYTDEKDKVKKESIKGADIIYNGVAIDSGINFVPKNGNVSIIDNDGDSNYDVVIISDFTEVIFSNYSKDSEMIYGMYGKNVSHKDAKTLLCIEEDTGKTVSLGALVKGTILVVYKSSDGKIITVRVVTDSLDGEVISLNSTDNTITVEGEEYKYSKTLQDLIAGGKVQPIEIGGTYKFYFNQIGEIANYERKTDIYTAYENAYLMAAGMGQGVDPALSIKVKTQYNMDRVYKAASRVKVDGTVYSKHSDVYTLLCKNGEWGADTGSTVPQLIRIKLNKKDEITHIDMAANAPTDDDSLHLLYDSTVSGPLRYYTGARGFVNAVTYAPLYGMTTTVPVFAVNAANSAGVNSSTKVNYSSAAGTLVSSTEYSDILLYGTDKDQLRTAIALRYAASSQVVDFSSPFCLLLNSNVSKLVNGEAKKCITFTQNGTDEIVLPVSEDIDLNAIPYTYTNPDDTKTTGTYSLKPGDIFRYVADMSGEITKIEIDYDMNNDKLMAEGRKVDTATCRLVDPTSTGLILHRIAGVEKSDGEFMKFAYNTATLGNSNIAAGEGAMTYLDTIFGSGGTAVIYSKSTQKARKMTLSDLLTYENVGSQCSKGVMVVRSVTSKYLFVYED